MLLVDNNVTLRILSSKILGIFLNKILYENDLLIDSTASLL